MTKYLSSPICYDLNFLMKFNRYTVDFLKKRVSKYDDFLIFQISLFLEFFYFLEMIPEESIDCDLEAPSNYKPSLNNRKTVQPHKR